MTAAPGRCCSGVLNAIWVPVHLLWLAAGIKVKEMELAPAIQFRVNMLMAAAMLAVVGLAIYNPL